jgi:hypothetical protein
MLAEFTDEPHKHFISSDLISNKYFFRILKLDYFFAYDEKKERINNYDG